MFALNKFQYLLIYFSRRATEFEVILYRTAKVMGSSG